MMVSIPELDGATGAMVFGGRSDAVPGQGEMSGDSHGRSQPGTGEGIAEHNMVPHNERIEMLVARVDKLVRLRRSKRCDRKVAIVLFNFPPNAGATGTAAHLSVFESLFNTLTALSADGYDIELPESVDALRDAVLKGNSDRWGTDANVHERIAVNDHVREETWLEEIESQWGPAPGKVLSDGQSLFVLGAQFGNALVTIQPPMGYEGDPMRLLFEGSFAPNHAFSAFYRYLRDNYAADAVLHFGTHGALEFMPGKQVGMSGECWPDRLIGNLPNFYLYAANNPSEGLIAKRRSAATLVSYLTPGVAEADLYRDLLDLKETIDRWRSRDESTAGDSDKLPVMAAMIHAQAQICGLTDCEQPWSRSEAPAAIESIRIQLTEVEHALVPFGLHTVGKIMPEDQRRELLKTVATASHEITLSDQFLEQVMSGTDRATLLADPLLAELTAEQREAVVEALVNVDINLRGNHELDGILHALDGGFIAPVGGGDLIRSPDILPTGRNIHGFDPYRLPSQFAVFEGERQACQLLARHQADGGEIPKSIALVLWGTDNLKSEGIAIGQALALIGARPRLDSYGRIAGAELIPLENLNRPRVDVVMTLSGIFRDLLPLQTRLLAEATYLAAEADEPAHLNPIRANTLAWQVANDSDFETAALRVFSNAEGTYGANVNMLVDSGNWQDENELADTFTNRKGHAYGRDGAVAAAPELLGDLLGSVDFAYQNLDSVELGVTTIDHYFDTLGGISRAIHKVRGDDVPVYIADHTSGSGKVRTLSEQVALETRTRVLNPKWYEAMLDHGYEGVRAIETHVTNTVGWSATTGQVAPWVYQQLSETFILDESMRKRLAALNPVAAARVANRLLEAQERNYWSPDEESLEALKQAGEDLEDWIEGVSPEVAA